MNLTQISQRLANLTQQFQQILSSAKRIEELPEQNSLVASSKIHVSNGGSSQSLEIQKIIEAANNLSFNRLLFVGDFVLNGNILTIPELTEWVIENQIIQHVDSIDFNIPFSAADKIRREVIYGNQLGEILRMTGLEILDEGIEPPKPNIPPNTVEITSFLVTDSEIGVPDVPIVNGDYIAKYSRRDAFNGQTGANVLLPAPTSVNGVRLIGSGLISIDGFLNSSGFAEPVLGDLFPITNATGGSVRLNDSNNFITGGLILGNHKVAMMRYEGQGSYRLVDTGENSSIVERNLPGIAFFEKEFIKADITQVGNINYDALYAGFSTVEGWIMNDFAENKERFISQASLIAGTSGSITFALGFIDQRGIFIEREHFVKPIVNGLNHIEINRRLLKNELLAVKLPIADNLIGSIWNVGSMKYTADGYTAVLNSMPDALALSLDLKDVIINEFAFQHDIDITNERVTVLENRGLTTNSPDGTIYEITASNNGEVEVGGLSYNSVVHLGNSLALHPWSLDPGSYWWGNWGMAASEKEKDYVHQFKSLLEASGSTVENDVYTIVGWEWEYATWDKAQLIPMIDGKELVVIRLGENVSYAPDFKAEFKELLQYILNYNPSVKLLVGGLFWFNELKETAMREATLELGLPFVQLYQLNTTENQSSMGAMVYGEDGELHEITVSGVAEHPGDLGMQRIAETLFSGLGANAKKPLAFKEEVLLKEHAWEEPQPYTEKIIPLRTEDGSLKMTRVILTESNIFDDNMTSAVGMFAGTNLGVKFNALALKRFLNTESTLPLIIANGVNGNEAVSMNQMIDNVLFRGMNYTVNMATDFPRNANLVIYCDASGGDFTITLPSAGAMKGYTVWVLNNGPSGTVTVQDIGLNVGKRTLFKSDGASIYEWS